MTEETQGTAETLAQDTTAEQVSATQETEQQVTEGQTEDEAGTDTAGDEKPERKRLSGAQKAKRRETFLLNQLADRDRELEELRTKGPRAESKDREDDKTPREEDFNGDYFAYQAAKSAHDARQAVREEFDRQRQSEHAGKQAEAVREREIAHMDRIEDAREVITDFDQVMETMKGVNVRNDVIEEIMSSDKSALLSYHLAKNPEKLRELNTLTPRELAREMGRLEATVKLPVAKKQTSAPPPLKDVKGGTSPANQEADLAAYMKRTYGEQSA